MFLTNTAARLLPMHDEQWSDNVLIVVPSYNEEESLPAVLDALCALVPLTSIVIVDDGSTDDTSAVAHRRGVQVVRMPFNVGVGGALRAGLLLARRRGISIAVQCDGDGQHPPDAIPRLVAGLATSDIVIGARFAGEGEYHVHGPRMWAIRLLASIMSRVHGASLTDVTSGFRAFGPRAIAVLSRELPPEYLGDTVEALVIAREHGLRVSQVPVAMLARQGGVVSHQPGWAALDLARAFVMLALSVIRLTGSRRRRE
jgi:glycosyltransferase involved in cell wall biosynthesis